MATLLEHVRTSKTLRVDYAAESWLLACAVPQVAHVALSSPVLYVPSLAVAASSCIRPLICGLVARNDSGCQ